ncbi:TRAP transporter large permease subunit, partial [Mycobacterium tuberculosis]|nr:TRAP transporter large permease subunit [Mycobacterium tuberculosis]
NLSVAALFTGGLVAGLILAAALALALHVHTPAVPASPPAAAAVRLTTFLAALPVIGLGAVIFFGIDLGLLTPTEASAAAAGYALV